MGINVRTIVRPDGEVPYRTDQEAIVVRPLNENETEAQYRTYLEDHPGLQRVRERIEATENLDDRQQDLDSFDALLDRSALRAFLLDHDAGASVTPRSDIDTCIIVEPDSAIKLHKEGLAGFVLEGIPDDVLETTIMRIHEPAHCDNAGSLTDGLRLAEEVDSDRAMMDYFKEIGHPEYGEIWQDYRTLTSVVAFNHATTPFLQDRDREVTAENAQSAEYWRNNAARIKGDIVYDINQNPVAHSREYIANVAGAIERGELNDVTDSGVREYMQEFVETADKLDIPTIEERQNAINAIKETVQNYYSLSDAEMDKLASDPVKYNNIVAHLNGNDPNIENTGVPFVYNEVQNSSNIASKPDLSPNDAKKIITDIKNDKPIPKAENQSNFNKDVGKEHDPKINVALSGSKDDGVEATLTGELNKVAANPIYHKPDLVAKAEVIVTPSIVPA